LSILEEDTDELIIQLEDFQLKKKQIESDLKDIRDEISSLKK